jgi:hypothetical protein
LPPTFTGTIIIPATAGRPGCIPTNVIRHTDRS